MAKELLKLISNWIFGYSLVLMALMLGPFRVSAAIHAPLTAQDSREAFYTTKITVLKKHDQHYYIQGTCSGSLFLNLKTVVTAAHCLDFDFDLLRIEFGVHPSSENYLDVYTDRFTIHPKYTELNKKNSPPSYGKLQSIPPNGSLPKGSIDGELSYQAQFDEFKKYYDLKLPVVFEREYKESALIYDMALIFLDKDVDAKVYTPLTLPSFDTITNLQYGDTLTHSGFGIQKFGQNHAATHMASSSQTLVRKKTFHGEHVGVVTFAFHHIFPCLGDSGGPLTLISKDNGTAQLIGVTAASVIQSQCLDGIFYSSPLFHWDWIQSAMLNEQ